MQAYNILKNITKVLFPRNKVFLNQIGRAFYYKRRFLQVKSRVLKQPLSHEIPLAGGEKIYYKIPAWDPSANEVFLTKGLSDWGLERLFKILTQSGGLFIDVGAHTGYFAHLFYDKCEDFILIETSKRCVSESLNPLLEEWTSKTIKIVNAPAFDVSGVELEIAESADGWGMSDSINSAFHQNAINREVMTTVTIDGEYLSMKSNLPVTAIKIDVDGPDIEVLEGAKDVIAKYRPIIFIENSEQRLLKVCKKIGYECFTFNSSRENPSLMYFTKLTDKTNFDELWAIMCLLVPTESSVLLNSLVGFRRNNHDKIHLFEEF